MCELVTPVYQGKHFLKQPGMTVSWYPGTGYPGILNALFSFHVQHLFSAPVKNALSQSPFPEPFKLLKS